MIQAGTRKELDAQKDLINDMPDFISDLVKEGYSEIHAFEKAEAAFAVENQNNPLLQSDAKWIHHFEPPITEAIGLYYAASMCIGLTIGALLEVILQMVILQEAVEFLFFILVAIGLITERKEKQPLLFFKLRYC